MALEGDVRTMPVRDLLDWLARSGATGTLSLTKGMVVRRFHLSDGRVTLASSSEQSRLLGQMLVEMGRIDAGQLETVLRAKHRYGERLGMTLTLQGLVSEEEVASVLREKVRHLLSDALSWRDGRFAYEDGDPVSRPVVPIVFDVAELLGAVPPLPDELEGDGGPTLEADVIEEVELTSGGALS